MISQLNTEDGMMDEQEQVMIEGTIAVVASTGGIKLKEHPDTWFNPSPHVKPQVTKDLRGRHARLVLEQEGSNIIVGLSTDAPEGADEFTPAQSNASPTPEPLERQAPRLPPPSPSANSEAGKGTGIELARRLRLTVMLQGREYITHAGLLTIAHRMGFVGSKTEVIQLDFQNHIAVVKASVTMMDPLTRATKTFEGLGDATPENTKPNLHSACLRMAETRAVNRALRQATNIGLTSLEELPERPSEERRS